MTGRQLTWIARAAAPMFVLMVLAVLLIYAFPQIVTYLPSRMSL
jgi:TRAP-type C4-dicarboxylate transport system permease large subunit